VGSEPCAEGNVWLADRAEERKGQTERNFIIRSPHPTALCVVSFSHLEIYENGRCRAFDGDAVHSVAKLHVHSNSLGERTEEIPKKFV